MLPEAKPASSPLSRDADTVRRSGLLDERWYLQSQLGSPNAAGDATIHYLTIGEREGLRPNPIFDPSFYFDAHPALRTNGASALVHYLETGAAERHDPGALFATAYYRSQGVPRDEAAGATDLGYFLGFGAVEGRNPHPLFDTRWYLGRNPDVANAQMNPLWHFIVHGAGEGRNPHPLFDVRWYLEFNQLEIAHGVNPLEHFLRYGADRGFMPNPEFNTKWYLEHHPDVAGTGLNPLVHYVLHGAAEGRRTSPGLARKGKRREPQTSSIGVNLVGPLFAVNGLGASARGYLSALEQAGVVVHVVPWEIGFEHVPKIPSADPPRRESQPINLIHLNFDLLTQVELIQRSLLPRLVHRDRYNVAIAYWELASIAPEWFDAIAQFDEIWCATSFMARTFAAASKIPVRVVRPGIVMESALGTARARCDLGLPEDRYLFAYVMDACSGVGRKNPFGLLKAYVEEFRVEDGAACILKVRDRPGGADELVALRAIATDRPDVLILDQVLDEGDMAEFFRHIDCYVSPHRAEGLGITIIEAMKAGKPVVASRYGGVADFVDAESSFVVDHKLVEVGPGNSPYRSRYIWAEPDHASLRQALRASFSDRRAAAEKGRLGQMRVQNMFSVEASSRSISLELDRIWSGEPLREEPLA